MSHLRVTKKAVVLALAGCALGAAPSFAQSNTAASAPPPSSDIGPGELSNFSLNGTVTRPAEPPPAARPQPVPAPATAAPATGTSRPAAPSTAGPPAAGATDPASSDLFRRPPTLPDASAANAVTAAPPIIQISDPTTNPSLAAEGFSLLPWFIALFAVAGMAIMFFGRQRRQKQLHAAGHPAIDIARRETPEPTPRPTPTPNPAPAAAGGARRPLPTNLMPPPPAPRQPPASQPTPAVQPKPDPIVPGGIVSTGLRPWIDIDLIPDRALLDEDGVAIAFELTLFNSGSAAARDVIIEATLLNAGASQDVELSEFFAALGKAGDPIPQIAPYARIPLRSAVRLPRTGIREYAIEGRQLFVPLVALSVRYRWSSGEGQSAAGFLVGQAGDGQEKLAPFRVDRGARSWRKLGVRRYEKGLRS